MILGVAAPDSRRRTRTKVEDSAKSMKPVRPSPPCTMRSRSGKELAALDALKNSTMSGCPIADFSAATTVSNGLELMG